MKPYHLFSTKLRLAGRASLIGVAIIFFLIQVAYAAMAPGSQFPAPPSFADLAEAVRHSVVNISTTQVVKGTPMLPFSGPGSPFGDFFGKRFPQAPQGEMKTHALGSGFIIDKNGLILTNNHVVEKASEIKVKLESGKIYDAKLVGRDPRTDLALIQVTPDADFPGPVLMGDSDAMRVGDWVIAVGNPFGLGHTVTDGIISATGRIIGAGPYDDFLQTDAAINPGNSGGPLFNMKGEVIGINTAIIAHGQGIGFSIPINMAKELLPQLKSGKVIRGWLGVMIQDITPDLAKSFGLKTEEGVLISEVIKDSPADKAGLKAGDVVIRFDGREIKNAHVLSRMVAMTKPGSQAEISIIRNSKESKVSVTIGTMPEKIGAPTQEEQPESSAWGLSVQELTPDLAQHFGLGEEEKGVVVTQVEPESPAAEAGIQPGDLIKEVNRQPIRNMDEYTEAIKAVKKGESLLLLIKRGEGSIFVVLKPESKQ